MMKFGGSTPCGDRIHQGEATSSYEQIVASRFATLSEIGEFKLEAFSPTGAGTDDGRTWTGTLPIKGDSLIEVSGTRGNASYDLTVEIR
jgi:hypothetical protein